MPRITINKPRYMETDLVKYIAGEMYTTRTTQAQMGELLGISRQAFAKKMQSCSFDVSELIKIFHRFGTTGEEVTRLLTY